MSKDIHPHASLAILAADYTDKLKQFRTLAAQLPITPADTNIEDIERLAQLLDGVQAAWSAMKGIDIALCAACQFRSDI